MRYTIEQREWTTGPGGSSIWIIPGRQIVCTLDELPQRTPRTPRPKNYVRDYCVAYLSEHGDTTSAAMAPMDGSIRAATIAGCMSDHPDLFVSRARAKLARGPKLWRLRGGP